MYFVSLIMSYFNVYIVLSLGINYESVLRQFIITQAGLTTDFSIPLGLCMGRPATDPGAHLPEVSGVGAHLGFVL